jgi:hypothetical protein
VASRLARHPPARGLTPAGGGGPARGDRGAAGRSGDRLIVAALSRCLPRPEWHIFPVRPETLLRWHRSLALQAPLARGQPSGRGGAIVRRDRLGGLIHEYDRAAA